MSTRDSLFPFVRRHGLCFVNWRQITLGVNIDLAYREAVVCLGPFVVGWAW